MYFGQSLGVVRVTLDPTITLSIMIYIGFLVKKAHFSPSTGYFFVPFGYFLFYRLLSRWGWSGMGFYVLWTIFGGC